MVWAGWYSTNYGHVDEKWTLVDGFAQLVSARETRGSGIAFRLLAMNYALQLPVVQDRIACAYANWLLHKLYVTSRP